MVAHSLLPKVSDSEHVSQPSAEHPVEILIGTCPKLHRDVSCIMALLGVDIPALDGHVQLRFLMTKKRTLKMMECVEGFVNSEVLEAVQQRTVKVKIARMAIVEVMMEIEVLKERKEAE
jgi:hypothetical protein